MLQLLFEYIQILVNRLVTNLPTSGREAGYAIFTILGVISSKRRNINKRREKIAGRKYTCTWLLV
jgi:hypothetical protein